MPRAEDGRVRIALKTPFVEPDDQTGVCITDSGLTVYSGVQRAVQSLKTAGRDEDAAGIEEILSGRYQLRVDGRPVRQDAIVDGLATTREIGGQLCRYLEVELVGIQRAGLDAPYLSRLR